MKVCSILLTLFLFPLSLLADLTGTYKASGIDPNSVPYTAIVVISKTENPQGPNVFSIEWFFSDASTAQGTGLRKDDVLSFVYQEGDTYGVQQYAIKGNILRGPFVNIDSLDVGHEKLTKIPDHDTRPWSRT